MHQVELNLVFCVIRPNLHSWLQGALPVLADEFLLKEVDRAMAIFVTRKKTEGQSLTIKEVRNKANQMVTVLRGKKTLYRVGK